MKAFITGIGSISAQGGFGNEPFQVVGLDEEHRTVIEPDYSPWIDQRSIRRMSKVIRMSVGTALLALKESGVQIPDAIVVGTGFGCVEDTGIFLSKLIENNEEALNPTPFIQSTHNTMGSQIALLLQCVGYNQTFTQRGFSFELALQDALLYLQENKDQSVLVGGVDERTGISDTFLQKLGVSVVNGEAASFFVLSNRPSQGWGQLVGMKMVYKPKQVSDITIEVDHLLESASISKNEIDLVLSGSCGEEKYDALLNGVLNTFDKTPMAVFKDLCGEFSTASGFGLWLACMILKKELIPAEIMKGERDRPVKTILLYNQYLNQHHSLILLKAC